MRITWLHCRMAAQDLHVVPGQLHPGRSDSHNVVLLPEHHPGGVDEGDGSQRLDGRSTTGTFHQFASVEVSDGQRLLIRVSEHVFKLVLSCNSFVGAKFYSFVKLAVYGKGIQLRMPMNNCAV